MRRLFRRADFGFTFVETLAGIVILALVLAAAAPLARRALRYLGTLARDELRLHDLARAYDAFRSACEETRVPPWASSGAAVAATSLAPMGEAGAPGGFRVAYLGGVEGDTWKISAGGAGLLVETPRLRIEVPVERARVERIEAGGRIVGLGASFESLGRTWAWKGYFGAAGY